MKKLTPEELRKQLDEYKQKKEIKDQQKKKLSNGDTIIVGSMFSLSSLFILTGIFFSVGSLFIVLGVVLFILALFKISRMEIELEAAKDLGPMLFACILLPIAIFFLIVSGINFKSIAIFITTLLMFANGILFLHNNRKDNDS